MKKANLLFGVIILTILFTSCIGQYGNDITQSTHRFATDSCITLPENVFIYFEGEHVPFDYTKRSLVEVMGNQYSNDEELLNRLKYQAYSNCANAIINIKWTWVQRVAGTYGDPKCQYTYNAKVYSGLAVKISNDNLYKSDSFGNHRDVSYQEQMKVYQKRESDQAVFQVFAYLIAIGVCVVYVIAKGAK